MHEEIKTRLNSENAFYHSVENTLSSRLLYKNASIKIYVTIILPLIRFCSGLKLGLPHSRKEDRVLRKKVRK
jgi:hypothetical protein